MAAKIFPHRNRRCIEAHLTDNDLRYQIPPSNLVLSKIVADSQKGDPTNGVYLAAILDSSDDEIADFREKYINVNKMTNNVVTSLFLVSTWQDWARQ